MVGNFQNLMKIILRIQETQQRLRKIKMKKTTQKYIIINYRESVIKRKY